MLDRATSLGRIRERREPWDVAVIGGGSTGIGIALDAATRGYATVLLEQSDFGKGTSSRSTKLVHGGVRYLQQGNVWLVREALRERGRLRSNAPHLVHDLEFIIPLYHWWEVPYYTIGLKVYDRLAGHYGFGPSQFLSRAEVLARAPTVKQAGLFGGVKYHDGQFDDSRLLINLAQSAAEQGACLLNYARVTQLLREANGQVSGLRFRDGETDAEQSLGARVVINATGPFSDQVRRMDDPAAEEMIAPSQGIHVVLPRTFLPGSSAVLVPRTRDGRVMFAIPWYDHVLVGTTDTPIDAVSMEPGALDAEVDFVLQTAGQYLTHCPSRSDVLSVFAGIRPLQKRTGTRTTSRLSRDHSLHVSASGLVTITGGKWTTYRRMAEDAVDRAAQIGRLPDRPSRTNNLAIHGSHASSEQFGELSMYGSDAPRIRALMDERPELSVTLHEALPIHAAQIVWAVRNEMARTVEDFLARRTRALYLNTLAAVAMAPAVATWMALELGRDQLWQQEQVARFAQVARQSLPHGRLYLEANP